jgi:hypothetical protein
MDQGQQPPAGQAPVQQALIEVPLMEARPVFALTPATAHTGIIDYSRPSGAKIYNAAVAKLQEDLFDVEPNGIIGFLTTLKDRSLSCGWGDILLIPKRIVEGAEQDLVDFVNQYGEVTLSQIRAHAATYVNTHSRAAQDSYQLYSCLMNSLSSNGRNKIAVWKKDYFVQDTPSGPALLKVIIRESHIDTRATVRHIRAKLSSMVTYLPTISYDITKFNQYVRELLDSLHARGEDTQDLLANLFEAYKSATDKDFVNYIKQKENDYDEGREIDPITLMQLAQNKYKTMVDEKTWAVPSKEEEKIIALEAKITRLSNKKKGTDNKQGQSNNASDKKQGKKNKKKKKDKDQAQSSGTYTKPAWQTKAPTSAERGKSKKVDGKDYWWCPNHKSWTRHKPDECRGVGQGNTNNTSNTTNSNTNTNNRQLRLTNALETIAQDTDE